MPMRYRCPHCKAILNPGTKLILRISLGGKVGLVLFSPKVGNYQVILPEDFSIKKGEKADFHCPVCEADLTSPADPLFGEVLRDNPQVGLDRVNFHKVYGEHATFVITKDEVRAYGDDAPEYQDLNFFGSGRGAE